MLYRFALTEGLECQRQQDRVFWEKFLKPKPGGGFLEVGAGDGVVGSQTLGLEREHGWAGLLVEPRPIPGQRAGKARKCGVLNDVSKFPHHDCPDLLAIHRPAEFPQIWEELGSGRLRPEWVVVENRGPDPQWCRMLERSGYRLRFFFHDDEYFQLTSR